MNNTIPSIYYDPSHGYMENIYGYADMPTLFMANMCMKKAGANWWRINHYRVYSINTADAPNAFSFNNATGRCYMNNELIISWNPVNTKALWAFDSSKILYAAGSVVNQWVAINSMLPATITTCSGGFVYEDINIDRTAINAMITEYGRSLILGFYGF